MKVARISVWKLCPNGSFYAPLSSAMDLACLGQCLSNIMLPQAIALARYMNNVLAHFARDPAWRARFPVPSLGAGLPLVSRYHDRLTVEVCWIGFVDL